MFVLIALSSSGCADRPMQVHRLFREFAALIHKVWMYMKVKPLLPLLEDLGLNIFLSVSLYRTDPEKRPHSKKKYFNFQSFFFLNFIANLENCPM